MGKLEKVYAKQTNQFNFDDDFFEEEYIKVLDTLYAKSCLTPFTKQISTENLVPGYIINSFISVQKYIQDG